MSDTPIIWLADGFTGPFPPTKLALSEPDGLLAAGGNLEPETLLQAYKQGIFPWYNDDQPILWWSPALRCVLYPEKMHISRSLKRTLNKNLFEIKMNTAFKKTMLACAKPRKNERGTWINQDMIEAYCTLHELGHAHSIECWFENRLVGGVYGVQIGQIFFGESMFSRMKDASKVAMVYICNTIKPALIDAQVYSKHLESMGAENIDRDDFEQLLKQYC
jgi:leucyl/phenylalanyl-tRNA--protein transferase